MGQEMEDFKKECWLYEKERTCLLNWDTFRVLLCGFVYVFLKYSVPEILQTHSNQPTTTK